MNEMGAWRIIDSTEVVLERCGDDPEVVPAMEIWRSETDSSSGALPSLNEFGIRCSGKPYSLRLLVVPSEESPFGCVKLQATGLLGDRFELSDGHRSDHLLANGVWHPINKDAFETVFNLLNELNVTPGEPLTLGQYISFATRSSSNDWVEIQVRPSSKELSEAAFDRHAYISENSAFTGSLYDYQQRGSAWISFMLQHGTGVVLGDCMGLGKTIQIISVVCGLLQRNPGARILIVCPSALMENWIREFDRFSTGITKEKHAGPNRTGDYRKLRSSVVVTTYDLVGRDMAVLSQIRWDLVVLDEGQCIKNPGTRRTKAAKQLPRKASIVVTGTPFENHMTDLWSIFDFCIPGSLGSLSSFKATFKDDDESAQLLGEIIAPLMLRRDLEDAALDLPDLVQIPMPIELGKVEAEEYERRRLGYLASGASLGAINNLINDLAYPARLTKGISDLKYEYVKLVSDEVFESGEKEIIFADKVSAIGELLNVLNKYVPTFTLTGADPINERQGIIDAFSETDGSAVLIANPVVGGAGLNITAANHVIHFSPQWNPAKVDQADARAHRNGQKKTVFAHYPYYVATIEEYMWNKLYMKRGLSEQVVTGNKGDLSANEIVRALSISPVAERGI